MLALASLSTVGQARLSQELLDGWLKLRPRQLVALKPGPESKAYFYGAHRRPGTHFC